MDDGPDIPILKQAVSEFPDAAIICEGHVHTLQERYGLKPIATPEADLRAILGG